MNVFSFMCHVTFYTAFLRRYAKLDTMLLMPSSHLFWVLNFLFLVLRSVDVLTSSHNVTQPKKI